MGFFKLAGMTIASVFKKPETIQYPKQTKRDYKDQKGVIVNKNLNDCTLCGICSKKCPSCAIDVDRNEKEWKINHFSCIQCGYCITICPKKCLIMDSSRPKISTEKEIDIVKVNAKEKKHNEK